MAIHCVFVNSKSLDDSAVDRLLRKRFANVYRVGAELWLMDSLCDAEEIAMALRPDLTAEDKLFVAGMTRDFVPLLSGAAQAWLTAPERTFAGRSDGRGRAEGTAGPWLTAA